MRHSILDIKPLRWVRGVFYGWWLVGLALVIQSLAGGPIWSGLGVWLTSLERHFGWSRTQLTGAFSLAQMEGSIIGPLSGFLIDKLGPRRMIFIGLLVVGGGFVVFSRTSNLTVFYLSFALLMLGSAAGTWLPLMTTVSRWFVRKRSLAMSIAGEGNFVGGLALVPVLAWAVGPDNFGWRTTALGIGVVFLAAAILIPRFIRNSPQEYGQYPDGKPPAPAPTSGTAGIRGNEGAGQVERGPDLTFRQAVATQAFWMITFGHAFSSMINQTLGVHLIPMLRDEGLSLQMAAYVWAVVMAVSALFQLVGGYLGDKVPKNLALFVFVTIQAGAFAMAILIHSVPMAFLIAALYGVGNGGRAPITVAMRSDYFGQRAFATITGTSMAAMHIFQLIGPLFAAIMFDLRGSYVIPFPILACVAFLGAILFLRAKQPGSTDSATRTLPAGGRPGK